jgi:TolA-binding protein
MTIVGLHPEELFDKLLEGEITPAEHERLRQHLEVCEVCRFEWSLRGDFQAEALALCAASPPPLLPLRTPVPVAPARPVRRRGSRVLVWGIAAAALISASGALASALGGARPWHVMSRVFSQANVPALQPAVRARAGCAAGTDCAASARSTASRPSVASAVPPPLSAADVLAPAAESGAASPAQVEPAPPASSSERSALRAARQAGQGSVVLAAEAVEGPKRGALAQAEPPSREPMKAGTSSAKLFAAANQARRAGDIGRALGLYRRLQEQFPRSPEAELSRVTLALLQLDSGDPQSALVGFERYLAGSSGALEAEALVGRARVLGRLGRRDLERVAWQEVRRKFPRSIYGRQASERLAALGQP